MFLLLILIAAAALAIGAGFLYQQWGLHVDRRRWPPPGRLVDISNGLRLHVNEAGSGAPAVIFESGIAATTLNWSALHQRISRFTKSVSYDRAGLGFSHAAVAPRTPEHIAAELKALLSRAGIPAPYILVGHSFGALAVRWYAAQYPEDVVGVVLVDPLRPEAWTPLSDAQRNMLARGAQLASRGGLLARAGVVRACLAAVKAGSRWLPRTIGRMTSGPGLTMMDRIAGEIGKMPASVWPIIAAQWSDPASFAGLGAHLRDLSAAIASVRTLPPLRGIPVTIITGSHEPPPDPATLQTVCPDARHIVAPNSGHWVHLDQPDLVEAVIRETLDAVRSVHTAQQG